MPPCDQNQGPAAGAQFKMARTWSLSEAPAMSHRLFTKAMARNIFYGGSVFSFYFSSRSSL